MTTKQTIVSIPRPHAGQQAVLDSMARFNVVCSGRRWGKSRLALIRAAMYLGDKQPVAYFSPTYKNLSSCWRDATELFRPVLRQVNKAEHRFEIIGGGSFELWSLDNPDIIRGRKYALALIDEAATVPDLDHAWNAVIRPTLTDLRGSADFYSTPNGHNYFYQLFTLGQDPSHPEWRSFHQPTINNPLMAAAEIEAAKQDLPSDIFDQEYLAMFRSSGASVFRNIEANLTSERTQPGDHTGHIVVAGVDWGQIQDHTAISIGCQTCQKEIFLDRFNQIDWSLQRDRLTEAIERWNVLDCLVEVNSIGGPNFDELAAHGLPVRAFHTTAQSKPQIIQSLALALEKEECKFLDDEIARRELEAYRSKRSEQTGRFSYGAPAGLHDDTVIARALMNEMRCRGLGVWL